MEDDESIGLGEGRERREDKRAWCEKSETACVIIAKITLLLQTITFKLLV